MKLKSPIDISVPVRTMTDGQIGIIKQWGHIHSYTGRIVQRFDNRLVALGMSTGDGFSVVNTSDDCRVIILQPGTEIVI